MSEFKVGSKVKVIAEGWCKDKIGRIEYLAPGAPKSIGLIIPDVKGSVWCKPEEIEITK